MIWTLLLSHVAIAPKRSWCVKTRIWCCWISCCPAKTGSVDLITTSEVSIALTLDTTGSTSTGDTLLTQSLLIELSELCRVEVEENLALVAIIGNKLSRACGVGKEVFGVLDPFNIRMICYGASSYNLCFLVPAEQAEQVVQKLHQNLFE